MMNSPSSKGRTGTRRSIQKEETRRIILESSRDLFCRLGFEATSTRAIAEKAGVGAGTIFSHFPDKPSLLVAVLLDDLAQTQVEAFSTLPENIPVCDKFLHLARHFYLYYLKRPDFSRILLKEMWFVSGEWGEKLMSQAYEFITLVYKLIEQAKLTGEIRPEVDAVLCARAFFSHYLNILYEGMSRPDPDPEKMIALLKELLNQLLNGIGPKT